MLVFCVVKSCHICFEKFMWLLIYFYILILHKTYYIQISEVERFVREAYEELIKQVQWANEEDKAEMLEKVKLIESIINNEMFVVTCLICSFF